ncbi:peptidylprolyl isomerase [Aurantiacibacter spongiae]|uniref:Peptidylprolyl isomerase n=1 Tax=Aurantiacibacter spongiae TaxID=2488860 RepID=A0A3N5DSM9_9SPHN|nr:peptidylprolyl isomerase [Aurantiacibacter spongiae]RPF72251.1 peptidylprolyl isomerase [Aurantiacibacter spongiae]
MKPLFALCALAIIAAAAPAAAQKEPDYVTPGSVVEAAAQKEWNAIPAQDLLVMDLAPDARGNPRRVIIQLMPQPFSQPWVENIRTLARAHWWDGTSVNRVQDNYVAQWGDATEEKPLPDGVESPNASYESGLRGDALPPDVPYAFQVDPDRPSPAMVDGFPVFRGPGPRDYAGFLGGIPFAGTMTPHSSVIWPVHCYGYIGVGRNVAPDTGTGAELYAIIGQPQRHMDRNLAVVGRVIEGMEHLASLPRGHGELGFYTEEEADLRTPIVSVRLASDMAEPPAFEYLDTTSDSFARYVAVRANRDDSFYTVPAGGADLCSVQVPIRRTAPE